MISLLLIHDTDVFKNSNFWVWVKSFLESFLFCKGMYKRMPSDCAFSVLSEVKITLQSGSELRAWLRAQSMDFDQGLTICTKLVGKKQLIVLMTFTYYQMMPVLLVS